MGAMKDEEILAKTPLPTADNEAPPDLGNREVRAHGAKITTNPNEKAKRENGRTTHENKYAPTDACKVGRPNTSCLSRNKGCRGNGTNDLTCERGREGQNKSRDLKVAKSCSPHVPESYTQRSGLAPRLLKRCRKVVPQVSNNCSGSRVSAHPTRPFWALTKVGQSSARLGHFGRTCRPKFAPKLPKSCPKFAPTIARTLSNCCSEAGIRPKFEKNVRFGFWSKFAGVGPSLANPDPNWQVLSNVGRC